MICLKTNLGMNGAAMNRIGLRICKQGANHNRQLYGYWGGSFYRKNKENDKNTKKDQDFYIFF